MKKKYNDYLNKEHHFDKLTMFGIICLIVIIAGIFGWVYEFIFYYFNSGMKTFYFRGGNFLPWINIYAIGAIFIFALNYKSRKRPLKVFLCSVIITGILEFVSGWIMYTYFNGFRCWDYNTEILNFGNIGGFICLRSVLFFGLSSLVLIYMIVPICFFIASNMNRKIFLVLSVGICTIFLMDELYNLLIARLFDLSRASDIYKQLGFNYMEF